MAGEHRCVQCNQQFAHKSKLQRHMESHLITGDWLCGLCDTLVNRFSALTNHWRKACPDMKHVFDEEALKQMSSEALQEAAFRHTIDKIALLQGQPDDEEPVDLEHSSLSPCVYCSLHLPRSALINHYKVHVNKKMAGAPIRDSPVPHICDICGFGFRFKKSLLRHWRTKCSELLAHVPEGITEVNNEDLREIVEDVVKKAERLIPVGAVNDEEEEEEEEEEEKEESEEDSDDDDDDADGRVKVYEETSSKYVGPIAPPDTPDYKEKWSIGQKVRVHVGCSHCDLIFVSRGRKARHESMIHCPNRNYTCELCRTKFKQKRIFVTHLREHCRAMKVEEPDAKKRKRMTRDQLMDVVDEGRQRWQQLFERKREQNLKFIEQFLSGLDRKRGHARGEPRPLLPSTPSTSTAVVEDGPKQCDFCKAVFTSDRFLQLHKQTVHQNDRPRNQLTVTATSLLPYFKLDSATFYDSDGEEYKMGKFLEKESDLAKHLKDKIVTSGSRADSQQRECFVAKLQGNEQSFVVLNEQEFAGVCKEDGKLRTLYFENPRTFDDWPVLQREC